MNDVTVEKVIKMEGGADFLTVLMWYVKSGLESLMIFNSTGYLQRNLTLEPLSS